MVNVLDKYKVTIDSVDGCMWLHLREWKFEGRSPKPDWCIHYPHKGLHKSGWRISGGITVPSMWFKPIEERIRIAVGYAVDVVKRDLAKDNAEADAEAVAAKWGAAAQKMFADAVKEMQS